MYGSQVKGGFVKAVLSRAVCLRDWRLSDSFDCISTSHKLNDMVAMSVEQTKEANEEPPVQLPTNNYGGDDVKGKPRICAFH